MLIKVPIPIQDSEDFYEENRRRRLDSRRMRSDHHHRERHSGHHHRPQHQEIVESDLSGGEEWTRLNRSYSVDTSRYMRHLQRKSKNFNVVRNSSNENSASPPRQHLNKLERQIEVLHFMENARTQNPFRSIKLKGLMGKPTLAAKKELRQMLQQEVDWASVSANVHSDEDMVAVSGSGYPRRSKHRRDRAEFGHYLMKDLNQFSNMIQHNDQYKKLQHYKTMQQQAEGNETTAHSKFKSKSKSPSRFSSSSPIPQYRKAAALAGGRHQHPYAQTWKGSKNVVQLQLKRYRSEKEVGSKNGGGRGSKPRLLAKKQFIEGVSDIKHMTQKGRQSRSRHQQAVRAAQDGDVDSPRTPIRPHKLKDRSKDRSKGGSKTNASQNHLNADYSNLTQARRKNHHGERMRMSTFRIEENAESGLSSYDDSAAAATSTEGGQERRNGDIIDGGEMFMQTPSPRQLPDQQAAGLENQDMIAHCKKIIQMLEQKKSYQNGGVPEQFQVFDPEMHTLLEQPRVTPLEDSQTTEIYPDEPQKPSQNQKEHQLKGSGRKHRRRKTQSDDQQQTGNKIEDLQTIQSNHQREQMQSSQNDEGREVGRSRALSSSLMTDTGIVSDFMSGSQAGNTPKSLQPITPQAQVAALPIIQERPDDNHIEGGGFRDQRLRGGGNDFIVPQQDQANPDRVASPEHLHSANRASQRNCNMMFDIGEPSQASDQVAAMLDLNIDPFLNMTSQHSSSIVHSSRAATRPGQREQARTNRPQLSSTAEALAATPYDNQEENFAPNQNQGEIGAYGGQTAPGQKLPTTANDQNKSPLSRSRPPLLKMRTHVAGLKERKQHHLAKDINEGKGNGSVCAGAGDTHFMSEQQNSIYQKAESSAKHTSKGQTWQAISVYQIPAGSAAQNESSQQVQQQQMGSVLSAANNNGGAGNGKLPSVEEQHNDASPSHVSSRDGFKCQIALHQKKIMQENQLQPTAGNSLAQDKPYRGNEQRRRSLYENDQIAIVADDQASHPYAQSENQSCASRQFNESQPDSFVEQTIEDSQQDIKPQESIHGTVSPDTSQQNLLNMFNQVEGKIALQKHERQQSQDQVEVLGEIQQTQPEELKTEEFCSQNEQEVVIGQLQLPKKLLAERTQSLQSQVITEEASTQTLRNAGAQTVVEQDNASGSITSLPLLQEDGSPPAHEPLSEQPLQVIREENSTDTVSEQQLPQQLPQQQRTIQPPPSPPLPPSQQINTISESLGQQLLQQQQESHQLLLQQVELQKKAPQAISIEPQTKPEQPVPVRLISQQSQQSQQVIVRSPFEQDLFEMLALAAAKPKVQLGYSTATLKAEIIQELIAEEELNQFAGLPLIAQEQKSSLMEEPLRLPLPTKDTSGADLALSQLGLLEQAQLNSMAAFLARSNADQLQQQQEHSVLLDQTQTNVKERRTLIELIVALPQKSPCNESDHSSHQNRSEIEVSCDLSSEMLSTDRRLAATIEVEGLKFKLDDLLEEQPASSCQEASVSQQSKTSNKDDEAAKFGHIAKAELLLERSNSEFQKLEENPQEEEYDLPLPQGSKSRSVTNVLSQEMQERITEQDASFKGAQSSHRKIPTRTANLSSKKIRPKLMNLKSVEIGWNQTPAGPTGSSLPRTSTIKNQLCLKMTQLVLPKVCENFENEKQKIFSRFVDRFYNDDNLLVAKPELGEKSDDDDEHLRQIYDNQHSLKLSRGETYWVVEMDSFGFENLTFSIVQKELVHQQETKILYQNNWNLKTRHKVQTSQVQVLTRMETSMASIYFRQQSSLVLGARMQRLNRQTSNIKNKRYQGALAQGGSPQQESQSNLKNVLMQKVLRQDSELFKGGSVSPMSTLKVIPQDQNSNFTEMVPEQNAPFFLNNMENVEGVARDIYETLIAEFPVVISKRCIEPGTLDNEPQFVAISVEIIDQASNLDLGVMEKSFFDQSTSKIESSRPSSYSNSRLLQVKNSKRLGMTIKGFERSPNKNARQMTNKWLHTSLYFNELKQKLVLQGDGSREEEQMNNLKWLMVGNDAYNEIYGEIDIRRKESQQIIDLNENDEESPEKAEEPVATPYRILLSNKHFRASKLFREKVMIYVNEPPEVYLAQCYLEKGFQDALRVMIQKSCYASYSHHLWSVSQESKQRYMNQGDRAQRYFASAMKHNRIGIRHIFLDSKASMHAFMRRSTIRQEIQDILFVRTNHLILDEEYVKQENRLFLIEKIRRTIQKSCEADFDQSSNQYQVQLRMQELDDLIGKQPDKKMKKLKPKAHTQFSKSLIYINFHPPDEVKRWVHQDYMDGLMKRDFDTPRYYGDIFARASKEWKCMPQIQILTGKAHTSDHFFSGRKQSARGPPANQKDLIYSDRSEGGEEETKHFPFVLNDQFGYHTLVLTDGCYQILVPSRPDCSHEYRNRQRVSAICLSTRSGVCSMRNPSESVSAANKPQDDTSHSFLHMEGDSSPITFKDGVRQSTNTSFRKQISQMPQISDLMPFPGREFSAAGSSLANSPQDSQVTRSFFFFKGVNKSISDVTASPNERNNEEGSASKPTGGAKTGASDMSSSAAASGSQGEEDASKKQQNPFSQAVDKAMKSTSKLLIKTKQQFGVDRSKFEQRKSLKKSRTQVDSPSEDSDGSSGCQFSFSISEEELDSGNKKKNQKQRKKSNAKLQDMKSSKFLLVPGSGSGSGDKPGHSCERARRMQTSLRRNSDKLSIVSSRSDSSQSEHDQKQAVAVSFQRQPTKVRATNFKKTLKLKKVHKHLNNVKNINREVINSMDQLKDTKVPSADHRKLLQLGIKPYNKHMNTNASFHSPDVRSVSPSPQKLQRANIARNRLTIVKRMDLQSTIDKNIMADNKNAKNQHNKKSAINQQEETPTRKPMNILSATLLQLRSLNTSEKKYNDDNSDGQDSNNQSQIQVMKRMQQAVGSLGTPTVNRSFFKYQVSKPNHSAALLKMKSPRLRIQEKKEYEARLEAMERNKVFQAIEFNQIQVIEDYIKCHMLGVDVTDCWGNTLLSMAAQFGCWEICNLLIKEGANVNSQNKQGNTPLHYAIAYKRSNIVDLLVESGANETIKNKQRLTPWQGV